eukprot:1840788-Rhodomonas_salina.3
MVCTTPQADKASATGGTAGQFMPRLRPKSAGRAPLSSYAHAMRSPVQRAYECMLSWACSLPTRCPVLAYRLLGSLPDRFPATDVAYGATRCPGPGARRTTAPGPHVLYYTRAHVTCRAITCGGGPRKGSARMALRRVGYQVGLRAYRPTRLLRHVRYWPGVACYKGGLACRALTCAVLR